MTKKEKRFEYIYSQDLTTHILVDKKTGVHYLETAHGVTPLLDNNGNPIITTIISNS